MSELDVQRMEALFNITTRVSTPSPLALVDANYKFLRVDVDTNSPALMQGPLVLKMDILYIFSDPNMSLYLGMTEICLSD